MGTGLGTARADDGVAAGDARLGVSYMSRVRPSTFARLEMTLREKWSGSLPDDAMSDQQPQPYLVSSLQMTRSMSGVHLAMMRLDLAVAGFWMAAPAVDIALGLGLEAGGEGLEVGGDGACGCFSEGGGGGDGGLRWKACCSMA